MKYSIISSFIAIIFLSVTSCKKNETIEVTPDPTPTATISLASPAADQVFNYGDLMHIAGTIEGNVKMHGYHLAIINTASGDTVFQAEDHTHALTLNVAQDWQCDLTSTSDLKLYISSALNHDGLAVVKTVTFKAAP